MALIFASFFLVRGRGLLNGIVVDTTKTSHTAADLCLLLKSKGLLAKVAHVTAIRLSPPLCITEEQILEGVRIIGQALKELESTEKEF